MMVLLVLLAYCAYAVLVGLAAKYVANKVAVSKGLTIRAMPLPYFLWILAAYILIAQILPILLYHFFVL